MSVANQEVIKGGQEFMAGFDSAHDDAYFGKRSLPGGLKNTALVGLGLYPCDGDNHDPGTRVEVLTGACSMGVDTGAANFEHGYVGLELFVDGYKAFEKAMEHVA